MVKDKLLRINIAAIKQSMDNDVSIVWKPGDKMLADALSKKQSNSKTLLQVLLSGDLNESGLET